VTSLSRKDAAGVQEEDGDKTPPRENPLPKFVPKIVPFVKAGTPVIKKEVQKEVPKEVKKEDLTSKPMKSQNDFRAMLFKK